jgi:hypothetical protein
MSRDKGHRSSEATLRKLATHNLYWSLGSHRDDIIGELPLPNAGIAATKLVAKRFAGDRARAAGECDREAAVILGVRSLDRWSAEERHAWRRWAPLVTLLPGVSRWSGADRAAAVNVIRAKGGPREDAFVHAFDAHPKLGEALASLLRGSKA